MTMRTLTAPVGRLSRVERRADIDGLRALAILLVVVYHVWLGRVSGGVDVFLLVSAYLLTASFVRRADELGPSYLGAFWARRFARLLPAAAAVIVAVLVFTAIVLPTSQWQDMWRQAWASLLYVQNRELSAEAVDYYARSETFPSALQHFWSLSVQGQVFLLWPIVILAVVWLTRRTKIPVRHALIACFGAVFVASLAYSIWLTGADQQVAYFSTPARLWEFALGSLAALILPAISIPSRLSSVLGWTGLLALVTCGIVLDVGTGFPGVAALWPTLAAIAIMCAGQSRAAGRPTRLLASRPLTALGRIAYALYLVHWPILVAFMVWTDSTDVGLVGGVVVIAASLLAAWMLHRGIEQRPQRPATARRGLRAVAASVLVVAIPLGGWQLAEYVRATGMDPEANPGAAVLMPWIGAVAQTDVAVVPLGSQLDDEWIGLDEPCAGDFRAHDPIVRESCLSTMRDDDGPTLLVLGDSHAQQWMGALLPVLEEEGWNVVAVLKAGCPFAPEEEMDDECRAWRDGAEQYALDVPADLVMVMGTKAVADSPEERFPLGLEAPIEAIVESGSQVLLVRDNPRFDYDMFECAELSDDPATCAQPVEAVLAAENPSSWAAVDPSVHTLDLSEYLCPDGLCQAVIGNVAVYSDDNHLTGTYALSLAPAALAALRELPGVPIG